MQHQTLKHFKLGILSLCNKHLLKIWFPVRQGGNRVEGAVIFKTCLYLIAPVFVAVHGLSLVAASRHDSVVVMRWLLTAMASLLQSAVCRHAVLVVAADGLSTCGSQALERGLGGCGTWP